MPAEDLAHMDRDHLMQRFRNTYCVRPPHQPCPATCPHYAHWWIRCKHPEHPDNIIARRVRAQVDAKREAAYV